MGGAPNSHWHLRQCSRSAAVTVTAPRCIGNGEDCRGDRDELPQRTETHPAASCHRGPADLAAGSRLGGCLTRVMILTDQT
jgi:hypothetical protein